MSGVAPLRTDQPRPRSLSQQEVSIARMLLAALPGYRRECAFARRCTCYSCPVSTAAAPNDASGGATSPNGRAP